MWWTTCLAVYMYLINFYHAYGFYDIPVSILSLLSDTNYNKFHSYCSTWLTMYPEYSLHDVVRCHLCESPGPLIHCVICKEYLCKYYKEKHLSDEFKEHKVVPLKFISKCKKHSSKTCYLFCECCNSPLCVECVSSREHNDHDFANVVEKNLKAKNMF